MGRFFTLCSEVTMNNYPLLEKDRIQHAYLFCGQKGVKRLQAAINFAKQVICSEKEPGSCGTCSDCTRIDSGNHPSVTLVQPDGSTVKIQQIKELQKRFSLKGMEGSHQVYIIEDADRMTLEASNSLLKFLEEPEGNTVAILLVEEPDQLVATIVSRCQLVRLDQSSSDLIAVELMETGIPQELANILSHIWNEVDKVEELVKSEKFATIQKIVVQLTEDLTKGKHQYVLILDTEWFTKKPTLSDTEYLLDYILYWFREILLRELGLGDRGVFPDSQMQDYQRLFSVDTLQHWLSEIIQTKQKLRYNVNVQLTIEAMLLRMQEELMCTG